MAALNMIVRLLRKDTFRPNYFQAQPNKTDKRFSHGDQLSSNVGPPLNHQTIFNLFTFPGVLHYTRAAFDLVVPISKFSPFRA
ncbi:hypothetical protein TNCT_92041 [Trichonephila clavata]|uniref:Uncharacterized protein n=1 Tax=Trichonephila clavata TaxID=2740835 RepID=A0A8X6K7P2_TRICU|nr:hypothetical protein TNCT_92041 [Trichonephila clavata]